MKYISLYDTNLYIVYILPTLYISLYNTNIYIVYIIPTLYISLYNTNIYIVYILPTFSLFYEDKSVSWESVEIYNKQDS